MRERKRRRPPEPLAVATDDIAIVVEAWIAEHERRHPRRAKITPSAYGDEGPLQISVERYLVDESDCSFTWVDTVIRRRKLSIPLSVADDILTALGRGWMLGTVIPIYANPEWTRARVTRELCRRGVDIADMFWCWPGEAPEPRVSIGF